MITVIQLVSAAKVDVDNKIIGAINKGIVALIGIERTDTESIAQKMLDRILNYRIFPDEQGKMNLSLSAIQGGLLLVPQFTLVAETNKGTRPGFSAGMAPENGKKLFNYMLDFAKKNYTLVEGGEFGAYMEVSLCNNGPVTFILHAN